MHDSDSFQIPPHHHHYLRRPAWPTIDCQSWTPHPLTIHHLLHRHLYTYS
jgi:hypothetical protein